MNTQSSTRPAQSVGANSDASTKLYSKVKRRILPFLVLCYIVALIDRSNVGFARLQFMEALSFSEAVFGIGGGLFYVGYFLFEVPSNLMLQRVGVRVTFLRIMVLWGLVCAVMAFMNTPTHFYVLRFLLGAAEAGLFPGVLLYITFWIPLKARARVTAIFMASIPIAGLISGPLSGGIMHYAQGAFGMQGWQLLFIIEGLPACVLGIIAYFYLDNGPKDAKWLSAQERDLIARDLAQDGSGQVKEHKSLLSAVSDRRVYVLAATALSLFTGAGAVSYWVPTVIHKSGVHDVLTVGLLSAIPFIIGIGFQYAVARHSDKKQERRWHAALSLLVAAGGWALLATLTPGPLVSVIILVFCASGILSATGPFWTLPGTVLTGPNAPAAIALVTTLAGLGNVFIPMIVGWLLTKTGSLQTGQYVYSVVLCLGALILLFGTRNPAKDTGRSN